jgi:phosphate transport system ATP-binding protein
VGGSSSTTARGDVPQPVEAAPEPETAPAVAFEGVSIRYGDRPAVVDVTLDVPQGSITALIGPSGSGKSTLLRAVNRMNELLPGVTTSGRVLLRGEDVYGPGVDPVVVRQRVGMVFQRPNPFGTSIADNVAFGLRLRGRKRGLDPLIETALRRAALFDEVKDRLDAPAHSLSGGQQQRLCIARALAVEPDVLLLDEPCAALDPLATLRIEDLLRELRTEIAVLLVTHNLQQAARVSDRTAFLGVDLGTAPDGGPPRPGGRLIEVAPTEELFTRARDRRTEAYLTGRFG